jgi:hypothetical protein
LGAIQDQSLIESGCQGLDSLLLPLSSNGRRADMLTVLFQFKAGPHARRL